MPKLTNRVAELLMVKSRNAGRQITRTEVTEKTGLSRNTVDNYYFNRVSRYDSEVVLAFCAYFGITPSEFFDVAPGEDSDAEDEARLLA